jgi:DNA replication protein
MSLFGGFPKGTKALPVPSPFLSSLLADIGDVAELKCTLRFLWHASQVNGMPKWVDEESLLSDSILAVAIGSQGSIRQALDDAVQRGTLVESNGRFLLKTPENSLIVAEETPETRSRSTPGAAPEPAMTHHPNIYALYESNIGLLMPMVADQLRDAEATYPVEWVEAAIKEAADRNIRNWRYISTILERWATDGPNTDGPKADKGQRTSKRGESGRHSQTASAAEYLRKRRTAD